MTEAPRLWPLPRIRKDQFADLAEVLGEVKGFPSTFPDWLEIMDKQKRAIESKPGSKAVFIDIRPFGLRRFISEQGIPTNWAALAKYVEALAGARLER